VGGRTARRNARSVGVVRAATRGAGRERRRPRGRRRSKSRRPKSARARRPRRRGAGRPSQRQRARRGGGNPEGAARRSSTGEAKRSADGEATPGSAVSAGWQAGGRRAAGTESCSAVRARTRRSAARSPGPASVSDEPGTTGRGVPDRHEATSAAPGNRGGWGRGSEPFGAPRRPRARLADPPPGATQAPPGNPRGRQDGGKVRTPAPTTRQRAPADAAGEAPWKQGGRSRCHAAGESPARRSHEASAGRRAGRPVR